MSKRDRDTLGDAIGRVIVAVRALERVMLSARNKLRDRRARKPDPNSDRA
jgi:hypothetical protein